MQDSESLAYLEAENTMTSWNSEKDPIFYGDNQQGIRSSGRRHPLFDSVFGRPFEPLARNDMAPSRNGIAVRADRPGHHYNRFFRRTGDDGWGGPDQLQKHPRISGKTDRDHRTDLGNRRCSSCTGVIIVAVSQPWRTLRSQVAFQRTLSPSKSLIKIFDPYAAIFQENTGSQNYSNGDPHASANAANVSETSSPGKTV